MSGVGDTRDLIGKLDELKGKTLSGVPGNVAVHQPHTWVVSRPAEDEVAVSRKVGNITTGRVVGNKSGVGGSVGTGAGSQDEEIVTVKMDRVSNTDLGLDDQELPDVAGAHGDDSLGGIELGIAINDLKESWAGPVNKHGGAVDVPVEWSRAGNADYLVSVGGRGLGSLLHNGNQAGESLIDAGGTGADIWAGGRISSAGGVVAKDTLDVGRVGVGGACARNSTDPVVTSSDRIVGIDNNVVTLAHGDLKGGSSVRHNGNEIRSHDSEGVVVDAEEEVSIGGTVDKTHAVGVALIDSDGEALASGHTGRAGVGVGTVEQASIESRRTNILGSPGVLVSSNMEPVVQHERTEIDVVVGTGRTVDDDRAEDTIPGLETEVRVIPGRSILFSLPLVGRGIAGLQIIRNDTLRRRVCAAGQLTAVGHWVMDGTPSCSLVLSCLIPWKWIELPLVATLLVRCTTMDIG